MSYSKNKSYDFSKLWFPLCPNKFPCLHELKMVWIQNGSYGYQKNRNVRLQRIPVIGGWKRNTYCFSNTWAMNFLMFKLVFKKSEKPEIKLPTSAGPLKKQASSRKSSTSALLTMPKPLTVWSQQTGKFWKRWEHQTTWPAFWELCMQARKQQLELDIEQQTGSKLGKEYVYCLPAYLTYMQSTSCKMPGWMKHKLESRLLGEISITSGMQIIPHLWPKVKRN